MRWKSHYAVGWKLWESEVGLVWEGVRSQENVFLFVCEIWSQERCKDQDCNTLVFVVSRFVGNYVLCLFLFQMSSG